MFLQIAFSGTSKIAKLALLILKVFMNSLNMPIQMHFLGKSFIAGGTFKVSFHFMDTPEMYF